PPRSRLRDRRGRRRAGTLARAEPGAGGGERRPTACPRARHGHFDRGRARRRTGSTMTTQHDFPTDEDLVLYHYGESPDAEAITACLARSAEAQARYAELRALLAAADEWTPELPANFEEGLWQRLQPRLAAERDGAPLTPTPRDDGRQSDLNAASAADPASRRVIPAAHRFRARVRRVLPAAAAATLLLAVGYL